MAFAADPDTEAPTVAKSFSTVAYTGTGSARSINGLGFSPSLVWIKDRSAGNWHYLFDSIRGGNKPIFSNAANSESVNDNNGYLSSFDADGFSITSGSLGMVSLNGSGNDYVAWVWKADDNEPTIFGGAAIAVYKFEDNANDVTGNYNATATNVTYSSSGKFNKAASFNGSSSKLDTGYTFANTTFSVSLWFKTTDTSKILITNTSDSTPASNNDGFRIYTDKVVLTQDDVNVVTRNFSSSLGDGNWHNVVVTNDGSTLTVYIDGSAAHTDSSTSFTQNNTRPVVMGYQPRSTILQYLNGLIDQVRFYNGAIKQEQVDELYAETASDNDDLTLGAPPETIISANANAGFSIVKYDGSGVSGTKISHGLSAAPNLILIKCISDGSTNWIVHHSSLGNSKYLTLNDNSVQDTSTNWLVPSATTFALNNTFGNANTSGRQYIAYCWHSVSGYSAFGSYAGNGTSQSINIGFKPDLLILRKYDDNQDWMIWDSVRDGNPKTLRLEANNADAEVSGTTNINFISTGFEFTSGFYNDSGKNSIYMAFKIN
jgi:archaellum component FlaG (FlaF/FlaG flagellin family)